METNCTSDETLIAFASQSLEAARASEVAAHISGCSDCRLVLASIGRDKQTPPVAEGGPLRRGMAIGRYVLGECVGVGGMGAVYEAHDPRLDRKVALKVLRDFPGEAVERGQRFLRERQILAGLTHPNIAQLLDGGETDEGRAYLVLEFIDGVPIDEYCDERKLSTRARLALFQPVCQAVHYAHQKLVVHRDLKPSNILVTADGTPKLVDFGIAKLLEGASVGPETAAGHQPMTPAFASPEQVAHESPTTATDVYALGVILYQLLSGSGPYRLETRAVEELLRAVAQQQPEHPSVAAKRASLSVVRSREGSAERLRRSLEGDVDAVVMMALRKSAADRYASAERLSEDLANVLANRPTSARRGSLSYLATLFVRRNKASVAAVTVALLLLLTGGGAALWQAGKVEEERVRAAAETVEAGRLGAEAEQMQELMRVEMLLPPHDLTPAFEQIRKTVARLSASPATVARTHAAFTLGRGLQLLGDAKAAQVQLSWAWSQGLRRPEVARALAQVEGRLYERELSLLGRIDDPARKKERLEVLAKQYREPAAERLAALAAAAEADRLVLAARLALLEQHAEEAVTLAEKAERAGGDLLETGELKTEARLMWTRDSFERGAAGTAELLTAALLAAQQAVAVGRSAPAPRLLLVRLRILEYDLESNKKGFRIAALDSIVEALKETQSLDPSSGELYAVWAGVEKRRGDAVAAAGGDYTPIYRSALELAERGLKGSSFDPRFALLQVANTAHALAMGLASAGSDPLEVNARGIEAAEEARKLAPGASGPVFNLAQLKSFRAWSMAQSPGDPRAAASEAAAEARRFLALGDRPVAARVSLAEALSTEADIRWLRGENADALLEEGVVAVREAAALAPKNWGVFTAGIPLVVTWCNEALAEGRQPEVALREGAAWAAALLPLSGENAVFAGHVGSFYLVQARAELLAGRDPVPLLDKAEPLLAMLAESQSVNRDALAEVALTRAAWARSRGKDSAGAVKVALVQARAAQALDEADAEGWALEARALLEQTPADGKRAMVLIGKALALGPKQGVYWLVQARAQQATGDLHGALVSIDQAAQLQPRLAP